MVSLDKWKCFCTPSQGLTLFTSRQGNQYIKCIKSVCGFFTDPERLTEYVNTYQEKTHQYYKEKRYPICGHHRPDTFHVSKSSKNPGRGFFACPYTDAEKKCANFFQWADELPTQKTLSNWLTMDRVETAEVGTMTEPCAKRDAASMTVEGGGSEKKRKKKWVVPNDQ